MIKPSNDFETWLHQKLRGLPDRRAPKNLIPSVLRKIRAGQSLIWWKRPWLEWPLALQTISAAVFAAAIAAAYLWEDPLLFFIRQCAASELARWDLLKAGWTIGESLLGIMHSLVAPIKTTYLIIAGMLALALYLAVVAIGALFCRVATEQSS